MVQECLFTTDQTNGSGFCWESDSDPESEYVPDKEKKD
jgi:hypothetical protein